MTLITKKFPVCYAVSKTSTSTEGRKREQEPEGLALNLHHIMGAAPTYRRGGKRFAGITESIQYHYRSANAKRYSPYSDAPDGIRVAVSMLIYLSVY